MIRLARVVVGLAACLGVVGPAVATDPVTAGLVEVNGTNLYVKRIGTGEPIVIIHGGPLMEHGYFLPHLYPLAESYELIFYDQRASGRSVTDVDPETMRVATFVDDIESLRLALDLGPIHLLGHSWGGYLAMHYALAEYAELRSLILVSSMPASGERWQEEEMAIATRIADADSAERAALRESEGFAAGDPETLSELLRLSFRPQFHAPDKLDRLELFVPSDYMARSTTYSGLMQDLMQFDHHDALGGIAVPTLIVYGETEPGARIGGAAIHEHIPGSRFVRIPAAGHFPFVEAPDEFLGEIRHFLESVGKGEE